MVHLDWNSCGLLLGIFCPFSYAVNWLYPNFKRGWSGITWRKWAQDYLSLCQGKFNMKTLIQNRDSFKSRELRIYPSLPLSVEKIIIHQKNYTLQPSFFFYRSREGHGLAPGCIIAGQNSIRRPVRTEPEFDVDFLPAFHAERPRWIRILRNRGFVTSRCA